MKKTLRIFTLLAVLMLFISACGSPSLDSAKKAAEKSVKNSGTTATWTVGKNEEENAVIVQYTYENIFFNREAIAQYTLDSWAILSGNIAKANAAAKEQMDASGYTADCLSYVYDANRSDILLYVKNGTVEYDYLEGAVDSFITLAKFEQIKEGMTYSQVCNIIGSKGELLSSVDLGIGSEYKTEMYMWYAADGIGNANVTFQDGKATMMAQFGLS